MSAAAPMDRCAPKSARGLRTNPRRPTRPRRSPSRSHSPSSPPPPFLLPPSSSLPSLTHSSARSHSPGLAAALTVPPRLRALRLAIAPLAIPASGASGSCAPAFQVYWRAGSGVLTPVPRPPPPEVGSSAAAATRPPSKRGHASPTHATSMSAILPPTPPPPPPPHTHSYLQLPPYVSRVRLLPTPSAVPPPGCLCARPPPCGAPRAHRGVWHLRRPQPQTAAGAIPVGCTATTSATRPGAGRPGVARRGAARRGTARMRPLFDAQPTVAPDASSGPQGRGSAGCRGGGARAGKPLGVRPPLGRRLTRRRRCPPEPRRPAGVHEYGEARLQAQLAIAPRPRCGGRC